MKVYTIEELRMLDIIVTAKQAYDGMELFIGGDKVIQLTSFLMESGYKVESWKANSDGTFYVKYKG